MSSSPNSSSSSSAAAGEPTSAWCAFEPYRDVKCPVSVVLGTGTITVRRCLAIERSSIIPLQQSAGEDLMVTVKGVKVARGEVVVVEDSASIRLTEICPSGLNDSAEKGDRA